MHGTCNNKEQLVKYGYWHRYTCVKHLRENCVLCWSICSVGWKLMKLKYEISELFLNIYMTIYVCLKTFNSGTSKLTK